MDSLTAALIQSALLILSGTGMACISIAMLNSRTKIKEQRRHRFSRIRKDIRKEKQI
ncbi:MAG: hypothetical protein KAJ56_02455 [Candidatus Aenigmarchaeota archaeon]|nr:hypothetical protein [Candidatus Aenigmarchaeota archaeon]MCK5289782.1 hypothetical protein [Candidatus Aenigmarchaeota archaeon]